MRSLYKEFCLEMKTLALAAALLAVMFSRLFAAPLLPEEGKRVSLEECIEIALKQSPQILLERCRLSLSGNRVKEAEAALLPGIEARLTHSQLLGSYVEAEGRWILFGGMERIYSQNSARRAEKAQEALLLLARRNAEMEVMEAAANLLLARRLAESSRAGVEGLAAQVERSRRELEAGKIAKSRLMELEAQLGEEEMEYIENMNSLRLCNIKLKEAMGYIGPGEYLLEEMNLEEMVERTPLPPYDSLLLSMDSDPESRAYAHLVERDSLSLKATTGAMLPKLSAGYIFSRGIGGSGYSQKRWELTLSLPILNGRSALFARRNAALQLEESRIQYLQKRLAIKSRLEEAWSAALTAEAKREAARKRLRSADEALRSVTLSYSAGSADWAEYIVARSAQRSARADYEKTLCQLLLQRMLLRCFCSSRYIF